jgi:hypothetical protein
MNDGTDAAGATTIADGATTANGMAARGATTARDGADAALAKPVFSAITQVSMVVDDANAYVRRYEEYGIAPWAVMDIGPEYVSDMTSHDQRVDYRTRVALCDYFDVQLELIEPLDDRSEYSTFLAANGPGIHHICLDAPDFDTTLAFIKKRNGPSTLLTGDSTVTYYEYLDMIKDLGFRAELVKWKEFD